jgi:hypothetical protein
MGMFDYFKIDYPLPIASYIPRKYVPHILASFSQDEFQTKDLDCLLDRYYVDNTGRIHVSNLVDFEEDIRSTYEKIYYHGHIQVHMGIYLDPDAPGTKVHTYDLWLKYDLKFTDSLLVSATMLSPTKEEIDDLH